MDRRDSKKGGNKQQKSKQDSAAARSKYGDDYDAEWRPRGRSLTSLRSGTDHLQNERKGKGPGVVRSKPCREIYRPPIVRKGRGSCSENSSEQSSANASTTAGSTSGYVNSVPNSPVSHSSSSSRPFNVYAKEFQYPISNNNNNNGSQMSYPRSQPVSYYPSSPNDSYNSTILATSGCYPLQQSKSSGNVNNFYQLWAHQQQQPQAPFPMKPGPFMGNKRRNAGIVPEGPKPSMDPNDASYFGLQQSKSSGNIPGRMSQQQQRNGKTVRFDFNEQQHALQMVTEGSQEVPSSPIENRLSKMQRDIDLTEKSLASLEIDGQKLKDLQAKLSVKLYEKEAIGNDFQDVFRSPINPSKFSHPQPLLQKSHTFFHVPTTTNITARAAETTRANVTIKRSKSYTPRSGQAKLTIPISPVSSLVSLSPISASSDFDITKWPKSIQESVTAAVIGADRVPARHRISMVGSIFNILLGQSGRDVSNEEPGEKGEKPLPDNDNNGTGSAESNAFLSPQSPNGLIPSAVNIFLYFVQREKDRTVMETVLNTCFATYQQLQKLSFKNSEVPQNGSSQEQQSDFGNAAIKLKWWAFLQFLSSTYAKLKIIRLQKSQQPGMKSVDELNSSILSLLCDSCLLTLRSPFLHTTEIMDLLFTIMTSIGREMESTFPMKMKQILAAVRDALLGIKPYSSCTDVSSPNVQKTLMQLIELHAANWHLPASAVRYYYSIPM